MISALASLVVLVALRDVAAIASYGVPQADAKVFDQVVRPALSKSLPRSGKSTNCKFVATASNAALEGVVKKMGTTQKEFREILPAVEKELGKDGNDLSFYLAVGTSLALQGSTGNEISDAAGDNIQKQIGYSLTAAGWDKLPSTQKSTIANVTKALLFVEFVVMAGEDADAKKKMSSSSLVMFSAAAPSSN